MTEHAASAASQLVLLFAPPGNSYGFVCGIFAAHSDVEVVTNAHVLTPLAYLGYYDNVYKAPYDHILAAEAQRLFVDQLPRKEADYLDACRAYCNRLYTGALGSSGKSHLLDATPTYARIVPFLLRVLPDARYVAVTRHPLALLAEGTPATDLLAHVKAVDRLSAQTQAPVLRLPLESMATDPRSAIESLCAHLGVAFQPNLVNAAQRVAQTVVEPHNWAQAYTDDPKIAEAQHLFQQLPPETWAAYGYTPEQFWIPLEMALGRPIPRTQPAAHVNLQRRGAEALRRAVQQKPFLNRLVRKAKLTCDVLLRD